MATAFIGLGSNVGNRQEHLERALEQLGKLPRTKRIRFSRWIETAPMGGPPQGMYLNGAVEIQTALEPETLLLRLQEIEQLLGRPKRHARWGPRAIDLDLLTYDDKIVQGPGLILPHPHLHTRPFVLAPLAEIAPDWIHPVLNQSAKELLALIPHRVN